ncbi:MAG: GGDEF domain-containing protein [Leptospira sp.]|jgi:diguanylate cyclase (GGDEF)-like protein|nr:GGDEF domain-containing protein [Leptospira sp.]NCS93409.1 GGDEF domain-containing protein [Leptospira sp.]
MKNEKELLDAQLLLDEINKELSESPWSIPTVTQADIIKNPATLSHLIYLLTNISLNHKEARILLDKTFEMRLAMSKCLDRPVDFRVSLLDLLINEKDFIHNPKVIEIKLYLEQERKTVIDYLTGLYNKRYFDEALIRETNQAKRHGRTLSILLIDIDDFKKVNDSYGHGMGDEVLKNLSRIIQKNTRKEDTICRTGGEEFTLLLPDTPSDGAFKVGEKIRVEFNNEKLGEEFLSFSGGVSVFPLDSNKSEEVVYLADKAMYYSKYLGKNQISIMNPNIREKTILL